MHGAVVIVVIANCTVEQMIAEDAVEGFALRLTRASRGCDDVHSLRGDGATRSHQFAVDLHHAGVAGLNGAKLGLITNLRQIELATVDQVDQALTRPKFL